MKTMKVQDALQLCKTGKIKWIARDDHHTKFGYNPVTKKIIRVEKQYPTKPFYEELNSIFDSISRVTELDSWKEYRD